MTHTYTKCFIINASRVRALMTKTIPSAPGNLEAMLGQWVDFLLSMPFCALEDLNATLYLSQDFQVQQKTHLAEKSLFFKDWRIKSCLAEDAQQEMSEAPPCHALPQEADCFLTVPFGILEDFFISFFTFSPGFLLSSAKHRQTNSCSRTKENLIPTQWDLRVGLGSLLTCAEMRTFVCSPHPPYYRQSDKLHKSHKLTCQCLLPLQEISVDLAVSPEGPGGQQHCRHMQLVWPNKPHFLWQKPLHL